MVNSKLNSTVIFNDSYKILDDDLQHNASVYQTRILGKEVEIVLGKERKTEDIVYYVAYVVLKNGKVRPVGIYEIQESNAVNAVDEDGDIELDKMGGPILFGHVDLSGSIDPDSDSSDSSESDDDPDLKETVEKQTCAYTDKCDFPDASRIEEQNEHEVVTTGLWIQQYMKNKNYNITDNEGGGDCLFAVIRDAFAQIGTTYTVGDLRKKLSDETKEDVFRNYLDLYTSFLMSAKETKEEMNRIATENNALKEQLKNEHDIEQQIKIVDKAKLLKSQFASLKQELIVTQQMHKEQGFMKNVKTFDQFKAMINTCRFWGDTWAISTLERILNVKFILFSEENFEEGDMKNVVQCGQLNDKILEELGSFTPDFYIIMDYTGDHYKLITYKERGIFKFKQLPFDVRDKIIDKCLERMAGPYAIIPDFVDMKLKEAGASGKEESPELINTSLALSQDNDPNTVFVYYSRSSSKPLPGKGTGEKIPLFRRDEFKALVGTKDWRKKLSNEWVSPIDIDGHQWQSVEHYYQGSKYKKGHPEIYYQFTLDSRSELGKSVEKAKKFNDVEPDMAFSGKKGTEILVSGLVAKYTQHPELKAMLLNTNNATLEEYIPRNPPRVSNELMTLRKNLKLK